MGYLEEYYLIWKMCIVYVEIFYDLVLVIGWLCFFLMLMMDYLWVFWGLCWFVFLIFYSYGIILVGYWMRNDVVLMVLSWDCIDYMWGVDCVVYFVSEVLECLDWCMWCE